MRRIVPATLIALCFGGCAKERWDDCFTGTGDIVRDRREVGAYSAIDLSDRFDLVIVPDSADYVVLETGDRLLEQMRTEVEGSTLVIRDGNTCNWVRRFDVPMTVYAHCRTLRALTCRGSGDVRSDGVIAAPSFDLEIWRAPGSHDLHFAVDSLVLHANTGPADVTARGTAQKVYIYSGDRSKVDTRELFAQECYVNNSGLNDLFVRAESALGAVITRSGNIYHAGSGSVAWSDITGTGQLIPL